MKNDIKEVLISEEEILNKVKEIGEKVSKDYAGKPLLLVGVLKGSVVFISDLMKNISIKCEVDFMAVSSYGNSTESSGVVRILKDLDSSIEGKNLLIVEDIIDSGVTLDYLSKYFRERGAKSVAIATLLNKPARRKVDLKVDYIGFEVPDEFIVGYGIDYAEDYRNLPFIGTLKPEVYEK